MNGNYITQALGFHGQPLQKIWEDERGVEDLQQWGVPQYPNFDIYKERQRFFTFQDRAKRLKLHQFLARKSLSLYDKELLSPAASGIITCDEENLHEAKNSIVVMPPYEAFIQNHEKKVENCRYISNLLKPGDIVYGVMLKKLGQVQPLCTAEPNIHFLSDLPLKGYIQFDQLMDPNILPLDKLGKPRKFHDGDLICCEILDNSDSVNGLHLGFSGTLTKNKSIKLGLISQQDLPEYYRKTKTLPSAKYEEILLGSRQWQSPCFDMLYKINGLSPNDHCSLMGYFKPGFPQQDFAPALRQKQASKWAYSSLTEGISYFRSGNHMEAFQCLNRALKIDPSNVEGLVARGALCANQGSFKSAIEDFSRALKVNEKHPNARKYLCETKVALGRSYVEEKHYDKALKAYTDVFQYIPDYPEAVNALKELKLQMASETALPNAFGLGASADLTENLLHLSSKPLATDKFVDDEVAPPPPRISKKSKNTESSSSDSFSDSDKFAAKEQDRVRELSLSPLSKRMLLHAASLKAQINQQFSQPFFAAAGSTMKTSNPNEFKLDEDDTEARVRDLLQGAMKHKKEKDKSKKKKSKKSKKDSPHLGEDRSSRYSDKKRRSESPPPKAPSMKLPSSSKTTISFGSGNYPPYGMPSTSRFGANKPQTSTGSQDESAPKLSFQIRSQIKLDKFGLYRFSAPQEEGSPTSSSCKDASNNRSSFERSSSKRDHSPRDRHRRRSRSRSRYRSGSRSRQNTRRCRSRSRSRSRSSSRRRHRRSKSPSYGSRHRRRSPSPFVPRSTPPPRRDRSPLHRNEGMGNSKKSKFGNLVWRRPGFVPPAELSKAEMKGSSGRWLHDKYEEEKQRGVNEPAKDDGPTIEEIDEIITKAQKERKEEILKRDKDILKKPKAGGF